MPPKKRERPTGVGDNGFGTPGGLNKKRWKESAVLKILEAMNLNPAGAVNTKNLVDAWKEEFGVGSQIDFLFLCMDGAPIYEILKLAEQEGHDYRWIVSVRYRLHEIMTDQKALVGVYWKSVLAPLAKLAGYTNPSAAHWLEYP
jgi:hypothetical protein